MNIFAFWHDMEKIPPYLQLCFETWRKSIKNHEVILLDYNNIDKYTDIRKQGYWKPLTSGKYRMALVADVIRVDLLCKYGGLWMDMDTIITSPNFENQYLNVDPQRPNEMFALDPSSNSVAFIKGTKDSQFLNQLKEFQIRRIYDLPKDQLPKWSYLCNDFTNPYMKSHQDEFKIWDITPCWAEYTMLCPGKPKERRQKYLDLYFKKNLKLSDLPPTSLLMLHNSWTPKEYRTAKMDEILSKDCTMSSVLRELTQ